MQRAWIVAFGILPFTVTAALADLAPNPRDVFHPDSVLMLLLIVAIVVEALVSFLLIWGRGWGSAARAVVASVIGTVVTHPVAWSIVLSNARPRYGNPPMALAAEAAAILVASIAYRLIVPLVWRRALFASLLANIGSVAAIVLGGLALSFIY
jgi:hypothetical protein